MRRRPSLLPLVVALSCNRPEATESPGAHAAVPEQPALPPELAAAIDALHDAVEAKRREVGTPGAALLVIKDGRVVHAAGYGERDDGSDKPVDADTVFAIGSTTKAFTAMLVMLAVDAGKLSLADSPKTCLPDFALADPQADANISIADLLAHSSGLGRTDMAWYAGGLSRAELLQVAARAQPVAPLGTRYNYQNLMFVAAGQCAAHAFGQSYEDAVRERIFAPLGMDAATLDHASAVKTDNFATGHARVGEDRHAVAVPLKNIDAIAPAGSINASIDTLEPWLRLMLDGGVHDGTRLVSEKSFAQLVRPHTTISPGTSYGLGWVLDTWRGERRVWHNGGIDGYYALISMLPEREIGFVLLTSDDSADLQELVTDRVFELAVPPTTDDGAADAARFAGTYGIVGGFQAVVATGDDGVTTLSVPQQAPYPLRAGEGDRFALGAPAPPGFFAHFEGEGEGEGETRRLTIEQPQGPLPLPWLDPKTLARAEAATVPKAQRELLATYLDADKGIAVRLVDSQGRVALSVAGQIPAPLVEQGEGRYGLDGLPNAFSVTVERDAKRHIEGLSLVQPQGTLSVQRVPGTGPVDIEPAALLAKVARAHGSAAMAEHRTLEVVSRLQMLQQGVEGTATTRHEAPARFSEVLQLEALGKTLGTIHIGHADGRTWERSSFSAVEDVSAAAAEALALQAPFDPWAEPMAGFTEVAIDGADLLPGADEAAIMLRRTTASGIEWTDAIGAESFLLLQRTTSVPTREGPPTVETERYGDYRVVGGVPIAHVVEATTDAGVVVSTVQSVRFDGPVPSDAFTPPALPGH